MKTLLLILFAASGFAQDAAKPETVMVTCHAKKGAEADLQRVLARHWSTIRDLKLVTGSTHVSLRGVDGEGKTYFVEIFTWRDGSVPDHAPASVQAIWSEMNGLVEGRGVEIAEVTPW